MHLGRIAWRLLMLIATAATPALAQPTKDPPGSSDSSAIPQAEAEETLKISAQSAFTWAEGQTSVVLLEGPVTLAVERMSLSARRAVVWLSPRRDPAAMPGEQIAEVALLGEARVQQGPVIRSGERLFVTIPARGNVRITAEKRLARDQRDAPLYREAVALRAEHVEPEAVVSPTTLPENRAAPSPENRPASPAAAPEPITFRGDIDTFQGEDGRTVVQLGGGVLLTQRRANGDFVELQAQRALLFTTLRGLRGAAIVGQAGEVERSITSAYLEGDVRITFTPRDAQPTPTPGPAPQKSSQRLEAERVYYDFLTDRAVLTDAIFHTADPQRRIPMTLRAKTLRQLARGEGLTEFGAEGVRISTSAFATPSYSVGASKAYVKQVDTGDPRLGERTVFAARDAKLELSGLPVFWLPYVGGALTERGAPLRRIQVGQSRGFGTSIETEWGLFETIGRLPPTDLDIVYELDYFSDRGPAGGIDVDYGGALITDTTKQPWNFTGDLDAYLALDDGVDNLGRRRGRIEHDDELRGQALWEHQHFFPENWQFQLRAGYLSDATFLEEWYENEFNNGLPREVAAYAKHQRDSEAITFLTSMQPSDVVTTAEFQQEQFEIERVPEVGYRRIGDSFGEDRFTFFSDNLVSGLRFNESEASLAEQGFRNTVAFGPVFPGQPAQGWTGTHDDWNYRGDFRQEVRYPFSMGPLRAVPYVMGRYTGYTESPGGGGEDRFFAGTGVRFKTTFWKVDNRAASRLFDVTRIRHVVEPELHLFTTGTTVERDEVFVYDEQIDGIHDVSAMQVALRQRWQTKRGGQGRWRSVDFFVLNLEGNFYRNQPPDAQLAPIGFRGLFFPSLPEASIPRNSLNADAQWRVSDTTLVLADAQHNLDEDELATASIGLAVQRGERVSYFVGMRYIEALDSSIASVSTDYELTRKYSLAFTQSFDFGEEENVATNVTLRRRFERLTALLTVYYDAHEDESGFRFALFPEGLGYSLGSGLFE